MILVFDTETSGLPIFNIPMNDSRQPHIVQLGVILLDKNFKEQASFKTLVKSTGWTIHPMAQAAHGITIFDCNTYGVPLQAALLMFECFNRLATVRVGHNIKFDSFLIDCESRRVAEGMGFDWANSFCTMLHMTNICKLPAKRGGEGFKWPKLQEAYKHCFGKEFDKAHDAMADVRACAEIYKWIQQQPKEITSTVQ